MKRLDQISWEEFENWCKERGVTPADYPHVRTGYPVAIVRTIKDEDGTDKVAS